MAKRLFTNLLVPYEDIKEEIRYITDSDNYYISESGKVYINYGNNQFFQKKIQIKAGYYYADIKYNGEMKHKRVHRLVAEAFIENSNNLPIVGHKDNNKLNPIKNNLYWTTIQDNTQKAFDDGLQINSKGYEDSQSQPIYVFDMNKNFIGSYGSISIAAKELNINKSTISRQCKGSIKTKPRCGYYFRYQEDYNNITPNVL